MVRTRPAEGSGGDERQPGGGSPPGEGRREGAQGETPADGGGAKPIPDWLGDPLAAVVAGLLTAVGSLTFVAAVGGAVVWVRYYAAQLPADQALAALPRGELIASGAVLLAAFAVLGLAAVACVYILDVQSSQKDGDGIFRGLLCLFAAEGIMVAVIAVDVGWVQRVAAIETTVLLAGIAFAVFWWRQSLLYDTGPPGFPPVLPGATAALLLVVGLAAFLAHQLDSMAPWKVLVAVLGVALAVACAIVVRGWLRTGFRRGPLPEGRIRRSGSSQRRLGEAAIGALAAFAVVLPGLILTEWWVIVALAAGVGLAVACGVVAVGVHRNDFEFIWLGLPVFLSVPLFGAVAGIARNLEEPQVQPVAFIRQDDGIAEAMQGIYVTETDERLYFASVATDQCTDELEPRSGRLLWVPRKEVVTMALGPSQSVEDAGTKALEMYYALAPGAVNPTLAADARAAAAKARERAAAAGGALPKRRLHELGPALRRDFDLEPGLSPSRAGIGDSVTLRTRSGEPPSDEDDDRQTLRVGGVEVPRQAQSEAQAGQPGDGRLPWSFTGRLDFAVPDGAKSGLVTVECGGFATEPYLTVRREPIARLRLRLRPGRGWRSSTAAARRTATSARSRPGSGASTASRRAPRSASSIRSRRRTASIASRSS